MSWITVIWSMVASACLTLALVHFVVWLRRREKMPHVLFALSAVSVAAIGIIELMLMKTTSVHQYESLIRWGHIPVAVYVVTIATFVHLYLQAGRLWLLCAACVSRLAILLVNFFVGANLNYLQINELGHATIFGERVSFVADAVTNPWTRIGMFSVLGPLNNVFTRGQFVLGCSAGRGRG